MTQRVIKFRRAYFNYDGSFYGFKEWGPEGTGFISPSYIHGCKSGEDQQFTGLLDKHGKEIYEHDIVRILYTDWPSKSSDDPRTLDEYMRDIAAIRIVIWSVNGFYLSTSINGYAESIEPGRHGYIEKIGDLYTTPELVDPKMIER